MRTTAESKTHLSTGDVQINLTAVGAHQSSELVADTLEGAQAVVLGEGDKEVLEDLGLLGTSDLLEFLDDQSLVGDGEGRGHEEVGQLAVGLQGLAEAGDGLGSLVEGGGLGRGSVL